MASTFDAALFGSLLGPTVDLEQLAAMGGVYAKYAGDLVTYENQHWNSDGAAWLNANYYDRASIEYMLFQATGNTTYLDRASTIEQDYLHSGLQASGYNLIANWSQMKGIALHYAETGNADDLIAIGKVADLMVNPYNMSQLAAGSAGHDIDPRIQARILDALIYADKTNAPSTGIPNIQPDGTDWGVPGGNNWAAKLQVVLNNILTMQSSDGAFRFDDVNGVVKPFMQGQLNDALINYYTHIEADPRIIDAVKKSVDYLWAHAWDPATKSFLYVESATPTGEQPDPSPDLNNLIINGFGFLYKVTGEESYKSKGDEVLAGAVEGAWLTGSKQFNQEYTSSMQYISDTVGERSSTTVPVQGDSEAGSAPPESAGSTSDGGSQQVPNSSNVDQGAPTSGANGTGESSSIPSNQSAGSPPDAAPPIVGNEDPNSISPNAANPELIYEADGTIVSFRTGITGQDFTSERVVYDASWQITSVDRYREDGSLEFQQQKSSDGSDITSTYFPSGELQQKTIAHAGGKIDVFDFGVSGEAYSADHITYDSGWNLISLDRYRADGSIEFQMTNATDGTSISLQYDGKNHVVERSVTNPAGNIDVFEYAATGELLRHTSYDSSWNVLGVAPGELIPPAPSSDSHESVNEEPQPSSVPAAGTSESDQNVTSDTPPSVAQPGSSGLSTQTPSLGDQTPAHSSTSPSSTSGGQATPGSKEGGPSEPVPATEATSSVPHQTFTTHADGTFEIRSTGIQGQDYSTERATYSADWTLKSLERYHSDGSLEFVQNQSASGTVVTQIYSEQGVLQQTTEANPNGTTEVTRVAIEGEAFTSEHRVYDSNWNEISLERFHADGSLNLRVVHEPNGQIVSVQYDAQAKVSEVMVTNANQSTEVYHYTPAGELKEHDSYDSGWGLLNVDMVGLKPDIASLAGITGI